MIGPKKRSEIDQELKDALSATTDNPIQRLDDLIREQQKLRMGKPGGTEVLESLRKLFEKPKPKKRPKKRAVGTATRK